MFFFLVYKPQVDPYLVNTEFVAVVKPEDTQIEQGNWKARVASHLLFVVEIHVNKGRAPIYFCQGQKAYFRLDGSIHQMDQSTINDRLNLGRPLKSGIFQR